MLLQRLREYYVAQLSDVPLGCRRVSVRYVIHLGNNGSFLSIEDLATPEQKHGKPLVMLDRNRTNGDREIAFGDLAEYTLGMPLEGKQPEIAKRRHDLYVRAVTACVEATGEPSVQAVRRFLATLESEQLALPEDFDAHGRITFEWRGVWPVHLLAVQQWWVERTSNVDREQLMQCLVCNEWHHPLVTLPVQIHGIPGGQPTGMALISANRDAFESYGLKRSHVAPVCEQCGHEVCTALNALLRQPETHVTVGESVYIFWSEGGGALPLSEIIEETHNENDIQKMLLSAKRGQPALISSSSVSMAEIRASSARVVIADWIDTTLGHVEQHIRHYFQLQRIADRSGEQCHFPVWRLTESDRGRTALLRFAVRGGQLPWQILSEATRRCKPEMTTAEAALLKIAYLSRYGGEMTEEQFVELDLSCTKPAYLCGRLYAILESIERRAMGLVSSGIKNYYRTTSARPAYGFGVLLSRAKIHLDKLNKKEETRGAYYGLSAQVQEILALLKVFPANLSMEERALFGIGYFNQQTAAHRAVLEAIAAKANKIDENEGEE